MRHEKKISPIQVIALVIGGIIGIYTITMPKQVITQAGSDAWLSAILGGMIALLCCIFIVKLSLTYHDQTAVEYLPEIYGRMIGNILSILLILFFVLFISFLSRFFTETARIFLMPNTPRWAILLLFWCLIVYWAQQGIRVIAITMTIILIPTFLNVAGFVFIPFERINLAHLLPVLGEGIRPVLRGVNEVVFFYFGFAALGFIIPVVREPKKLYINVLISFVIVMSIYTMLIVILIARFSTNEVNNMVYPVVTLMKTLQLPGAILERTDLLFFAIFLSTALDDAALYLYLVALSMVRMTKRKYYRLYIFSAAAIGYVVALIPMDPVQVENALKYLTFYALFFLVGIVPLGLILTAMRRKGKRP